MTQITATEGDFITVVEAAALLHTTPSQVRSLLEHNEIESLTLIHADSFRTYLANHHAQEAQS